MKSVYEQHSESTLLATAKHLIEWQKNLVESQKARAELEMEQFPEFEAEIGKINKALSHIFLLHNDEVLKDVLDRYQGE